MSRDHFTSLQSLDRLGRRGEYEGRFSRDPLPVFSVEKPSSVVPARQGCPLFDLVCPAFLLPTATSPILRGALKDGFGETVMALDRPKPCEFPSFDSGQKSILLGHREVDIAPHPVVGLVLHAGDAEKFPEALGLENLDFFFFFLGGGGGSKQDHVSQL